MEHLNSIAAYICAMSGGIVSLIFLTAIIIHLPFIKNTKIGFLHVWFFLWLSLIIILPIANVIRFHRGFLFMLAILFGTIGTILRMYDLDTIKKLSTSLGRLGKLEKVPVPMAVITCTQVFVVYNLLVFLIGFILHVSGIMPKDDFVAKFALIIMAPLSILAVFLWFSVISWSVLDGLKAHVEKLPPKRILGKIGISLWLFSILLVIIDHLI